MSRRALIIGLGQIGRAVAGNLVAAGWHVTALSRTFSNSPPEGIEARVGNREEVASLAAILGDGADAVVDTVAYDIVHAAQWRRMADRIGKLAVISSMSVYADPKGRTLDEGLERGYPDFGGSISEDCRRVAPGPETYSTRKVALENAVMDLDLPTAVIRPGAVYGVFSKAPREWWFVQRALAGMVEIPVAYGGTSRFHPAAAENIAGVVRVALDAEGSHVLNAVDPGCPTVAEIGELVLGAIGSDSRIVTFAGPPRGFEGATPWSIPSPMIASMDQAEALGYRPVTTIERQMPIVCADIVERARSTAWRLAFPGLALYPQGFFLD